MIGPKELANHAEEVIAQPINSIRLNGIFIPAPRPPEKKCDDCIATQSSSCSHFVRESPRSNDFPNETEYFRCITFNAWTTHQDFEMRSIRLFKKTY